MAIYCGTVVDLITHINYEYKAVHVYAEYNKRNLDYIRSNDKLITRLIKFHVVNPSGINVGQFTTLSYSGYPDYQSIINKIRQDANTIMKRL